MPVALDRDRGNEERSEFGEGSYRIGKVGVYVLRCAVRLGGRPPPRCFYVASASWPSPWCGNDRRPIRVLSTKTHHLVRGAITNTVYRPPAWKAGSRHCDCGGS